MTGFDPIHMQLGYLLHRVDVQFMAGIRQGLAELGLSPGRATALAFVASHPGCDQMSLGRELGVNRASTMKTVDELVSRGLVERRPGRDRRTNALHATSCGGIAAEAVQRITSMTDAANFSVLDSQTRRQLRQILLKLEQGQIADTQAA
jgi:DNA-binding MarR family transcriptional regulator